MGPRKLQLIRRHACELCEELEALLAPYEAAGRVRLEHLDVDEDPALHSRHAFRVPVLMEGQEELLWGRIEAWEVVRALGEPPEAA